MSDNRWNHLSNLNRMRSNYQKAGNPLVNPSDDTTNVGNELSAFAYMDTPIPQPTKYQTNSEDSVYKGLIRTNETANEFLGNVVGGVLDFVDGIFDAAAYGTGWLFGKNKDWADKSIQYQWQDQVQQFLTTGIRTLTLSNYFTEEGRELVADSWSAIGDVEQSQQAIEEMHNTSFTSELGEKGQDIYNTITTGIGSVLPSIIIGGAVGGATKLANATKLAQGISLGTMGISSIGGGVEEALGEGAEYSQAGVSGLISGAIETASEMIPIPGLGGNRIGNIGKEFVGEAVENISEKFAKKTAKQIGKAMLEEGSEELISEFLSPLKELPYKDFKDIEGASFEELALSFLGGAIGGAIGGGSEIAKLNTKYSRQGANSLVLATETGELIGEAQREFQRGSKANKEKLAKYRQQIDSNVRVLKEQFREIEASDKANGTNYYEKIVEVLKDPSALVTEMEKTIEQRESERVSEELRKISKGRNVEVNILSDEDYDNSVDPKGIGTRGYFTSKVTIDGKTVNQIVIRESKVDKFYELVAHEGISHGVIDMSTNDRNNLIKYIKGDKKLGKKWNETFEKVKEAYPNSSQDTLESETIASILEGYVTNASQLSKITDIGAKKGVLKLLNNLKKYVTQNNLDKKNRFIKQINKAIENINKETETTEKPQTTQAQLQPAYSRELNQSTQDSEGNTLSQEQIEFFEDSKVRDENGNLLVVYHTTNADFTVFDKDFRGSNTQWGDTNLGFFFSPDEKITRQFGSKTKAYYLNISKPLDLRRFVEQTWDEEGEFSKEDKTLLNDLATAFGTSTEELIEGAYDPDFDIEQLISEEEVLNNIKKLGYDGVVKFIDRRNNIAEYVAFEPNQIKLTSNTKPTENVDIRYSRELDNEAQTTTVVYPQKPGAEQQRRNVTFNRTNLVTNRANLFADKFITLTTAKDMLQLMIQDVSNEGAIKIKLNENATARDLFEGYNLYSEKGKIPHDRIAHFVDNFFSSKVTVATDSGNVELTIGEFLETTLDKSYPFNEYRENYINEIEDLINTSAKDTRIAKLRAFYNTRVERLKVQLSQYQTLVPTVAKAIQDIQTTKDKLDNGRFADVINANPKVASVIGLYNKLLKSFKVTQTNKGFSPNGVAKLLNAFKDFDMNILNDENIMSLLDTKEKGILTRNIDILKQNAQVDKDGNYSFPNGYHLTFQETMALAETISIIRKDINHLYKEQKNLSKLMNSQADTEIRNVYNMRMLLPDKQRKLSLTENVELTFASIDTNIGSYFGFNSDFYRIFYKDIMNAYNEKLIQFHVFNQSYDELVKKHNLNKESLNKKVKFKYKGKELNVTYGDLLDIYIESLSDNGLENLEKGGYDIVSVEGVSTRLYITENELTTIESLLTEDMKNFGLDVLTDLYNGSARDYKKDKDIQIVGYERVIGNVYYPKNKSQTAEVGADTINITSLDTSRGENIRETRNMTHLAIIGMSFENRFRTYIDGLTNYGEMYTACNHFSNLLNGYTTDKEGHSIKRLELISKAFPELDKYILIYEQMITGQSNERVTSKPERALTNMVMSTLGGNLSVVLKQLPSVPIILNEVSFEAFAKGVKGLKNILSLGQTQEYLESQSGILKDRIAKMDSVQAESLSRNLGKLAKAFGVPMELMDRFGILTFGYAIAVEEAKIRGFTGDDVNTEAIKILNNIIVNTQSNSISFRMSPARAGKALKYKGIIRLFSVFKADFNNKLNYIIARTKGKKQAKLRINFTENAITEENQNLEKLNNEIDELEQLIEESKPVEIFEGELENQPVDKETEKLIREKDKLNQDKINLQEEIANLNQALNQDKTFLVDEPKKMAKLLVSLFMSALLVAGVEQLMERILGRDDWDWDEENTKDFLTTVVIDTTIGNLPFVSEFLNAIEYDTELTSFDYSVVNNILDLMKSVAKSFENGEINTSGLAMNLAEALGYATGIPFKNLYNLVMGIYKNFSPDAYRIDNQIKGYSEAYIYTQYKQAIEDGHYKMAKGNLDLLLSTYKGGKVSEPVLNEMFRLAKLGYNVTPTTNLTEIQNEKGEMVRLTDKEKKAFQDVYNQATVKVNELLNISSYRSLSDEDKAKVIKRIYSAYYYYAKAKALNEIPENKLAQLLYYSNGNIDLAKYISTLQEISNTIATGNKTKKQIVLEKLNKVNLSKNEKFLILYLSGYKLNEENKLSLENYLQTKGIKKNSLAF